ncbi:MAG: sodium:solute symporter [Sporocytophaga sp.]|uniref:sodium:solute symporter n=1 Tax=Sporocytophaga sp. TaxID=2231183 RepID=UPI001B241C8D|nr:sodium:solute symporter [Sporocytophaga sp.]MBO9699434.1 sodium:solute symporter [Sporocytophaga sp.]
MSPSLIITIIAVYFSALLVIAYFTGKNADTKTFFTADRKSPWYLVAFGMIGTSISGVTFISVPGAVGLVNQAGELKAFSYFQIILGHLVGYFIIATVLMPLYYRLNLISIYTYLEQRFGFWAYKTGSFFFLLSRTIGSSLRLFLAAMVLQLFLFDKLNVPFFMTVLITIVLIWIYTFKGGVKTIIWTDSFQTLFLVGAVGISLVLISQRLGLSVPKMFTMIQTTDYSKVFFFDDIKSDKYFFKQFIAGIFIAVAMTGLDQDLMQKNLTCKNIKEAQKNMFSFSIIMAIVNYMFLMLGALLYIYSTQKGILLPAGADKAYPFLAMNEFGTLAAVFFLLGIIASSYASSDSALAALTTSFCIDFLDFKNKPESVKAKQKTIVHVGFSLAFLIIIVIFKELKQTSVIDAVLSAASYTYGPLLGLFSFGILTKRKVKDTLVPLICVLSPFITLLISYNSDTLLWGYKFSFETLILNGFICFLGLYLISYSSKEEEKVVI